MFKAIVHNRESGIVYLAYCIVSQKGFATLKDPISRHSISRDLLKFRDGNSYMGCACEEYGVKHGTLLIATSALFMEVLSDNESVSWANVTKEDAEKKLDNREEEAQKVHDEEKKAFLDKKSKFGRLIYTIFN
jgi:hypothetical protein